MPGISERHGGQPLMPRDLTLAVATTANEASNAPIAPNGGFMAWVQVSAAFVLYWNSL